MDALCILIFIFLFSPFADQDDGFVAPQVPVNTPMKLFGQCAVSAENQLTMGPLTTPTKGREVGSVDPWTPTSNLKMLISAASPDIRNREKELCMDNDGREGVDSSQVRKTLTRDAHSQVKVFKGIHFSSVVLVFPVGR